MAEELDQADEQFAAFHARFAPFFFRAQVRERSQRYLRALLGSVERKNGWQLAEAMGEDDPNGAQRLLFEAIWDEEAVQDELERFVADEFGDPQEGIFILDESGFPKKGTKSVGVKRQYCGALGKRENCQVGVFLTYLSSRGHVFLDRRLYLPEEWVEDAERRQEAGVPKDITFQTKPALGRTMLSHALDLGVRGGWVTGDEVYGSDGTLRRQLEERQQAYVLTVRTNEAVWFWEEEEAPHQVRVAELAASLPETVWQRLSAGEGAKGPRWYDWAWVTLPRHPHPGWTCWLLVRRSLEEPIELAYYLAFAPASTTLQQLVTVAGARWSVEQCLEEAKAGAHAFSEGQDVASTSTRCAGGAAGTGTSRWSSWLMRSWPGCDSVARSGGEKDEQELIGLSVPEVRRLFAVTLPLPPRSDEARLAWSRWRRRHQKRAQRCHYRRRGARSCHSPPNSFR